MSELKLITTKELASYLKVSRKTVDYWRYTRKIPYKKIGKHIWYDLEEIKESMERLMVVNQILNKSKNSRKKTKETLCKLEKAVRY